MLGKRSPTTDFCKLENHKSQRYNSVWGQRPEIQEATGIRTWVQRPWTKNSDVWGSEKINVPAQEERTNSPSFAFLFYSGPRRIKWWCPPTLAKAGIFTQSTEWSANFFQNTLKDTLGNNVLPSIWVSFSSIKLTHKINYEASLIRNKAIIKQQKFSFSLISTSTINLF